MINPVRVPRKPRQGSAKTPSGFRENPVRVPRKPRSKYPHQPRQGSAKTEHRMEEKQKDYEHLFSARLCGQKKRNARPHLQAGFFRVPCGVVGRVRMEWYPCLECFER
jgi:hypothetical protein